MKFPELTPGQTYWHDTTEGWRNATSDMYDERAFPIRIDDTTTRYRLDPPNGGYVADKNGRFVKGIRLGQPDHYRPQRRTDRPAWVEPRWLRETYAEFRAHMESARDIMNTAVQAAQERQQRRDEQARQLRERVARLGLPDIKITGVDEALFGGVTMTRHALAQLLGRIEAAESAERELGRELSQFTRDR